MWSPTLPAAEKIGRFLQAQEGQPLSYSEVGQSRNGTPSGYIVDHNRALLGHGDAAFAAGCAALRAWRMFPAPWTRIEPAHASIETGREVAMLARAFGGWWVNGCRIVYVIDETTPVRRFGFAYGTLPSHVETGEELFSVEQLADGSVWYDLRAFSRPRFWLVRLAAPLARRLQRRFAVESKLAMQRAVAESLGR